MNRERIETIETSLRRIHGVMSARIRVEGDEITEVHVITAPHRRAKGVVRDVLTTLFARHGIQLSHQKVSVATTQEPSLQLVEGTAREPRLLFRSVNVYREGPQAEAQVELTRGDRVLIGTARGAAVRRNLERLVGLATLQALGKLLAEQAALELISVDRRRLGEKTVMLAHLILLRGRQELHLAGSVLLRGDPMEATVFAVLDATNRILPALDGEDAVEYEVEDFPPEMSG